MRSGSFSILGPCKINAENSRGLLIVGIRDISEWPEEVINILNEEFPATPRKPRQRAPGHAQKAAASKPSSAPGADEEQPVIINDCPTRLISNAIIPFPPGKDPPPSAKSEYQYLPEEWPEKGKGLHTVEEVDEASSGWKKSAIASRPPGLSQASMPHKTSMSTRPRGNVPGVLPLGNYPLSPRPPCVARTPTPLRSSFQPINDSALASPRSPIIGVKQEMIFPSIEGYRDASIPPPSSPLWPLERSPAPTSARRLSVISSPLVTPPPRRLSSQEIRDHARMDDLFDCLCNL